MSSNMSSILQKIHKITLPTGFPVGDVNVYLIKDDPVTLIDTGANGAISEHLLLKGLRDLGLDIEDIKRIVITHAHLDHCGMAGRIQELSGAPVYIFEPKVEEMTRLPEFFIKRPREMKDFYVESAVPEGILSSTIRSHQRSMYMISPVTKALPLKGGSTIEFENLMLNVLHTPGHSDDMLCFYEKKRKILFSSDHITLNLKPVVRLKEIFKDESGTFGNMNKYFDSLDKIEKLKIEHTFPGHGESFGDPISVIKKIREDYSERKETVAGILKRGLKNRFELTRAVFGFVSDREIFKGIPEVTGHLELLEKEGRLTKSLKNGIMYYATKN